MSNEWLNKVWKHSPYKGAMLLLHVYLADQASDEGWLFASQRRLAERARVSEEYVRVSVNRMVDDGLLVIERKGSALGRSTEYRLLEPPNCVGESGDVEPGKVGEYPPTLTPQPPNSDGQLPNSAWGLPLLLPSVLPSSSPSSTDAFDEFWKAYPRREAKQAARKAWANAIKAAPAAVIIAGAERYRDDPNRTAEFTAHPATWLNAHRWEDDPLPARGATTPATKTDRFAALSAKYAGGPRAVEA